MTLSSVKYYLFGFTALLSGCTTSSTTGGKKLLGVIPIPLTKPDDFEPTKAAMAFEQLAPLVWAAIPLIVAGVLWWKLSGGSTGLGKLSVGIGLLFIAIAVVFPAILGYLGAITILALVGAIGYSIYYYFKKKKENDK